MFAQGLLVALWLFLTTKCECFWWVYPRQLLYWFLLLRIDGNRRWASNRRRITVLHRSFQNQIIIIWRKKRTLACTVSKRRGRERVAAMDRKLLQIAYHCRRTMIHFCVIDSHGLAFCHEFHHLEIYPYKRIFSNFLFLVFLALFESMILKISLHVAAGDATWQSPSGVIIRTVRRISFPLDKQ